MSSELEREDSEQQEQMRDDAWRQKEKEDAFEAIYNYCDAATGFWGAPGHILRAFTLLARELDIVKFYDSIR